MRIDAAWTKAASRRLQIINKPPALAGDTYFGVLRQLTTFFKALMEQAFQIIEPDKISPIGRKRLCVLSQDDGTSSSDRVRSSVQKPATSIVIKGALQGLTPPPLLWGAEVARNRFPLPDDTKTVGLRPKPFWGFRC